MKNNNLFESKPLNPQGLLVCPVCNKEFKVNDDTKYIVANGYTCSWKCFLNEVRKKKNEKEIENKRSKNNTKIKV